MSIYLLICYFRFIAEESCVTTYYEDPGDYEANTELPTWIIDPLDGTINFVHGYPQVYTRPLSALEDKGGGNTALVAHNSYTMHYLDNLRVTVNNVTGKNNRGVYL